MSNGLKIRPRCIQCRAHSGDLFSHLCLHIKLTQTGCFSVVCLQASATDNQVSCQSTEGQKSLALDRYMECTQDVRPKFYDIMISVWFSCEISLLTYSVCLL